TRLSAAALMTTAGRRAASRAATASASRTSRSARESAMVDVGGSARTSSRPSCPAAPTTTTRMRPRSIGSGQGARERFLLRLVVRRYSGRMARLWRYLLRYRVRYLGGIACLLAATSLAMCLPWLFRRCVNAIAAGAGPDVLAHSLGLIVLVALLRAVARTYS